MGTQAARGVCKSKKKEKRKKERKKEKKKEKNLNMGNYFIYGPAG